MHASQHATQHAIHANPRREQRRAARSREQISRNAWTTGAVLLILGLLLILTWPKPRVEISGPARTGQPMPDFTLTDLSGNAVRMSDYLGQPVLINAWATWCPPCRAEMPDLHAYYINHRAEGFVMLAVNAGENSSPVKDFIAQMGFTFPVLLDPGKAVLSQLGVSSFPTSILVDRDGTVAAIHTGMLNAAMLESKVTPLLAP